MSDTTLLTEDLHTNYSSPKTNIRNNNASKSCHQIPVAGQPPKYEILLQLGRLLLLMGYTLALCTVPVPWPKDTSYYINSVQLMTKKPKYKPGSLITSLNETATKWNAETLHLFIFGSTFESLTSTYIIIFLGLSLTFFIILFLTQSIHNFDNVTDCILLSIMCAVAAFSVYFVITPFVSLLDLIASLLCQYVFNCSSMFYGCTFCKIILASTASMLNKRVLISLSLIWIQHMGRSDHIQSDLMMLVAIFVQLALIIALISYFSDGLVLIVKHIWDWIVM